MIANADSAGGVIEAIETAVLAKLMPVADAPTVAGPPAREMALTLLGQIRNADVDRRLLSEEYSAFLSPARLSAMSKSLQDAGEITDARPGVLVERGGMEVSTLLFTAGTTPASALMYRSPDGAVQQFLFSRR